MSATSRLPYSAAERMRMSRQRKRDGLRVVPLEVREQEIAELITRGLLSAAECNDREAIVGEGTVTGLVAAGNPSVFACGTPICFDNLPFVRPKMAHMVSAAMKIGRKP